MQLFFVLVALLLVGKPEVSRLLQEVKPVLNELGQTQWGDALDKAEELAQVVRAVQEVASEANVVDDKPGQAHWQEGAEKDVKEEGGLPCYLEPIASFTDRNITYSLQRHFAP